MSAGVGSRHRVAAHIPIPTQPIQHGISAGELANRRVVIPGAVVIEPTRRVAALAGVAVAGGERATRIAGCAIRRVEAAGGDSPAAIERLQRRALGVGDEIRQRRRAGCATGDRLGDQLACGVEVVGTAGGSTRRGIFGEATDIAGGRRRATRGDLLRDPLPLAVVEVAGGGTWTRRRILPGGQPSFGVPRQLLMDAGRYLSHTLKKL